MRVVRYETEATAGVGVLDGDTIEVLDVEVTGDVPSVVSAVTDASTARTGESIPLSSVTLRAPIQRPGKIVCLGLNYADHADEGGYDVPDEPLLFAKATSAVTGPNAPVTYPADAEQLDYEAELAVVIGAAGRRIDPADALDYVAGVTVFNDVTARDVQYGFSQFFRGKSYDTFAPMGPSLVTLDSVDIDALGIRSYVNDELRQDSSTANMLFPVAEAVASVSETMTLYPGDVIATGTPPGVGMHRDPPELLSVGDTVRVEIDDVGTISNRIVDES